MIKKPKITFPEDNKIDDVAHLIIKELYGSEGAFLSNESSLEDFEEIKYHGHKLVSLSKVPKKEQKHHEKEFKKYPFPTDKDHYLVWYPPINEKEQAAADEVLRMKIAKKLKQKLDISIEDYPKNEPVYIWKIAQIIKQRLRES